MTSCLRNTREHLWKIRSGATLSHQRPWRCGPLNMDSTPDWFQAETKYGSGRPLCLAVRKLKYRAIALVRSWFSLKTFYYPSEAPLPPGNGTETTSEDGIAALSSPVPHLLRVDRTSENSLFGTVTPSGCDCRLDGGYTNITSTYSTYLETTYSSSASLSVLAPYRSGSKMMVRALPRYCSAPYL